jgi:signal recognition particle receptor subunit beta
MAEFDDKARKLTVKLVYYGPALSGKTTNLMRLHDLLMPQLKGDIMAFETQRDRTLYFDLLPVGFRLPSGLLVTVKLFTVPGQVAHNSTRKAVLSRTDGVVFVADSQRSQGLNNAESFQNLEENAGHVGLDFETLPLVVQFNKRDLPDIFGEEELRARWAQTPWPVRHSVALTGAGVMDTFRTLLEAVYPALNGRYGLADTHGLSADHFLRALTGGQRRERSPDERARAV